jgi:hypothetical protein
MDDFLRLFVGYDEREAAAYHVFCQSVIEHSSIPVSFIPLHKKVLGAFDFQRDGTNAFTFSRYLVPYLCDFRGWAIFCDGDMAITADIADLWEERLHHTFNKAVVLVKHDYQSRHSRKYVGSALESDNVNYPRKNWSSVMLWNCSHAANLVLAPSFVADKDPSYLHRFYWLKDDQIGELPSTWNYLVGEEAPASARLFHYTLGVPGFKYYADDFGSWHWHTNLIRALRCGSETPSTMVIRSEERVGERITK